MSKSYSYYPGCTLHATAQEYDTSLRMVCQALGLQLQELRDWVCCGATSAHTSSRLLGVALPAHTLQSAAQTELPLLVPCAACFSRLKFAARELEEEATRRQVEQALGQEMGRTTPILHPIQALAEEKIEVSRPLAGLKVACYYGCLLVRPPGVTEFDDVENPQSMDRLLQAAGAEPVEWSFKTECCGAAMAMPRQDMVIKLSRRILAQARQAGADCVATVCPLCHSNLDLYQGEGEAGKEKPMPVFYFTQLLGLALGFTPQQMLVKRHFADPLPLLRDKGLV